MATYLYRCSACGAEEVVIHPMSEVDEPTQKTIEETTCYCFGQGLRMKRVPQNVYLIGAEQKEVAKEKHLKQRRKRNEEHYVKNDMQKLTGVERVKALTKRGYDVQTNKGKIKADYVKQANKKK